MSFMIRTLRILLAIVALWQLMALPWVFTWFSMPPASIGAAAVTLALKLAVGLLAWLAYRKLAPVEQRYHDRRASLAPASPTAAKLTLAPTSVARRRIAMIAVVIGVATASTATTYFSMRTAEAKKPLSACIPRHELIATRQPDIKNYTLPELAALISQSKTQNAADPNQAAAMRYLTACEWSKVHSTESETLYVAKDTIRILPGNRRTASVLHDSTQALTAEGSGIYKSSLISIAADCSNGGLAVLALVLKAGPVGEGAEVKRVTRGEDASTAPLRIVEPGSPMSPIAAIVCQA